MNTRSNEGFTIIELVVVIAILGILAAVAMPKFASLESKARTAAFDGVKGGFTAAVQITHSKWLVEGGTGATVALDGATVQVGTTGWPVVDPNVGAGPGTQKNATELYALLMSGQIPTDWTGTQAAAVGAGTATYCLAGGGGGAFLYDAGASGAVTSVSCP